MIIRCSSDHAHTLGQEDCNVGEEINRSRAMELQPGRL